MRGLLLASTPAAAAVAAALAATALPGADAARGETLRSASPGRTLVLISAATGKAKRNFPDLAIRDAVADGRGGWFVVGGVLRSAGVVRHGLAHLRPDGRLDPHWSSRLRKSSFLQLVAQAGRRLYVYGRNRVHANEIDAIDARTGAVLWTRTTNQRPGVSSLAAAGSTVYVAGQFGAIGGVPRDGLAALDADTGTVGALRPPSPVRDGDSHGYFDALAVDGQRLFVGGAFSSIGGQPRFDLVVLRRSDGRLLSWRPAPGTDRGLTMPGDVGTILVSHGAVLTAGYDGFGGFGADSGRVLPWIYRISGFATSFGAHGRIVYLGGDNRTSFNAVDGKPRHNLAAIDVVAKRFTPWAPKLARYVGVDKIVPSGRQVLVAGFFGSSLG